MREVYGGVRVVTLTTRHLAKSRAFWVDGLGFALVREEPDRSVTVNLGTFRLAIERADDLRPAKGAGAALTFRVRNLAKTAKELDERGVAYDTFTSARTGDYLEAADPDGHRVVFSERL